MNTSKKTLDIMLEKGHWQYAMIAFLHLNNRRWQTKEIANCVHTEPKKHKMLSAAAGLLCDADAIQKILYTMPHIRANWMEARADAERWWALRCEKIKNIVSEEGTVLILENGISVEGDPDTIDGYKEIPKKNLSDIISKSKKCINLRDEK